MFKNAIVESITNYELKYNGSLLNGYDNIYEFKKDALDVISEKITLSDVIEHYKAEATSSNSTNSTEEQREDLKGLILELEGFSFWENNLKNYNY